MTFLFALLETAGAAAEAGTNAPFYVAGTALLVLIGSVVALVAFGGGREHS